MTEAERDREQFRDRRSGLRKRRIKRRRGAMSQ